MLACMCACMHVLAYAACLCACARYIFCMRGMNTCTGWRDQEGNKTGEDWHPNVKRGKIKTVQCVPGSDHIGVAFTIEDEGKVVDVKAGNVMIGEGKDKAHRCVFSKVKKKQYLGTCRRRTPKGPVAPNLKAPNDPSRPRAFRCQPRIRRSPLGASPSACSEKKR